jgi:hypothetical protein
VHLGRRDEHVVAAEVDALRVARPARQRALEPGAHFEQVLDRVRPLARIGILLQLGKVGRDASVETGDEAAIERDANQRGDDALGRRLDVRRTAGGGALGPCGTSPRQPAAATMVPIAASAARDQPAIFIP